MSRHECPRCGVDAWSLVELQQHNVAEHKQLDDRRQRALEAAWDEYRGEEGSPRQAIDTAIETATRVRVDDEIIDAARVAYGNGSKHRAGLRRAIEAAFVAAGFEVEQ